MRKTLQPHIIQFLNVYLKCKNECIMTRWAKILICLVKNGKKLENHHVSQLCLAKRKHLSILQYIKYNRPTN